MDTIKTIIQRFPGITRLEIETIIAHVLKRTREFVLVSPEYALKAEELREIGKLAKRRQDGEPLAYLTGSKEFYGLTFFVNRHVLVPRPETELMVEEALKLASHATGPLTIADVGTGSGCIAITLAKKLEFKIKAIDISKRALATAQKNAELNGVRDWIEFAHGNLLQPLLKNNPALRDTSCVICANLPYLTAQQIADSPSIRMEPRLALESGPDGLKHYRQLFRQVKRSGLKRFTLLCEIDDTQGENMTALIKKELPQTRFEIKQDLGGYDRLAIIRS